MKLIAFSGKKQSGKDTAAAFLYKNADILFPVTPSQPFFTGNFLNERIRYTKISPVTTTLYFARPMKEFCRDYLGIPHAWLWGTNADKDRLTHLKWEDLPHYTRITQEIHEHNWLNNTDHKCPSGFMTVREILQQVGEQMFLPMDPKVWTRLFHKAVDVAKNGDYDVAFVGDLRKPEQVDAVHERGGIVLRLLRSPYEGDLHISELALDPDRYDQSNFDAVIDNRNLSIRETHEEILGVLAGIGWTQTLQHCDLCDGIDPSILDWCDPS